MGFQGELAQHHERGGEAAAKFKESIDEVQAEQALPGCSGILAVPKGNLRISIRATDDSIFE